MKKLFSVLFVLVLTLAGCGSSSDAFVYAVSSPVESLDPVDSSYSQTFDLFADVFVGPSRVDGDANLVPGGAESIEQSADGLTYTIKLRQDAVWVDSSGEEKGAVTANDYVTQYQRMVDPTLASTYSYIFEPIKNAMAISSGEKDISELGVKAIDDYTLEITLGQVTPYFESMLAFGSFMPAAAGAVDEFGDDYGTSADTTWYNGPYYVTDFNPDFETTLTKNPSYFDAENTGLENITYRLNKDSSSRYNAVTSGELDFAALTTNEDYVDAKEQGIINDHLTGFSFYAVLNHQDTAVTNNENLRKALAYGFDRDSIVEAAYGEINEAIEYLIPSGMTGSAYDGVEYRDFAKDSLITYDKDKADEYFDAYMKDMGYTDRKQIEIQFLASEDGTGSNKIADSVLSHYNQNFGITVNLEVQPFEQFVESRKAGAFDMYITGWGPDYADPSTYLALWQTNQIGGQNTAGYSSEKYDELYLKANSEQDTEKRFTEFAELEQMLVDDGVLIPVYQKNEPYILTEGYNMPRHLFFVISHSYITQS